MFFIFEINISLILKINRILSIISYNLRHVGKRSIVIRYVN